MLVGAIQLFVSLEDSIEASWTLLLGGTFMSLTDILG